MCKRLSLGLAGCVLALLSAAPLLATASADAQSPQQEAASPNPQPGSSPQMAAPTPAPPVDVVLSDERTLTTWAHPLEAVPIYSLPDTHARRLTHLHLETEDGFEEIYLLLVRHIDPQGRVWVKLRIPGRPNGRTGWVLRDSLGSFQQTRWLVVINLAERRLTAYFKGRRRLSAPVGVGKPSSPTPRGRFWIRERFRITDPSNPYWPYALGTSDYSTLTDWPGGGVVGIHGDFGEPRLIPGDPSHGCVRMHAADIAWLATRVSLGTPVDII
ncbi:MAG: ErfK/YbiS/YcfS/YnhG family protein [Solirubrobacterales bacterium]|nr:ErfK/YbiS/YcfS/YnhG family protein [Solirubrobacterales bacterium]